MSVVCIDMMVRGNLVKKLTLGELSLQDIQGIAHIVEKKVAAYDWLDVTNIELDKDIQQQITYITARLINLQTNLINEATIWSRAIYPLLTLAEYDEVLVWAKVPISATYSHIELSGLTDGILAPNNAGSPALPSFVVVEAKRCIGAKNPCIQLYGQLLAVAHLHYQTNQESSQEIFGCYTIGDSWTFIRAFVEQIDTEKPCLTIESSRDYVEKIEAVTILKILNRILIKVRK